MFHTAPRSASLSRLETEPVSFQLWTHLIGVPLDLRHQEGLSLVAGLVGHPKETDDFTLNMVSLTTSHVKVEVNLLELLPDVVEFERENGEVVEVSVEYPWKPRHALTVSSLGISVGIVLVCLLLQKYHLQLEIPLTLRLFPHQWFSLLLPQIMLLPLVGSLPKKAKKA